MPFLKRPMESSIVQKHQSGFSLLEAMLAIVIVGIAGIGVYSLFNSGLGSYHITDASNEIVEVANVYTDLASADLTATITTSNIVSTLKNSGRLSSKYFSNDGTSMINAFSSLNFTSANAYSFTVSVPLGELASGSTVPSQFYSAVKDQYTCDGSHSYSDACVTTPETGGSTTITLVFNLTS